jgi:hypothetical protein
MDHLHVMQEEAEKCRRLMLGEQAGSARAAAHAKKAKRKAATARELAFEKGDAEEGEGDAVSLDKMLSLEGSSASDDEDRSSAGGAESETSATIAYSSYLRTPTAASSSAMRSVLAATSPHENDFMSPSRVPISPVGRAGASHGRMPAKIMSAINAARALQAFSASGFLSPPVRGTGMTPVAVYRSSPQPVPDKPRPLRQQDTQKSFEMSVTSGVDDSAQTPEQRMAGMASRIDNFETSLGDLKSMLSQLLAQQQP